MTVSPIHKTRVRATKFALVVGAAIACLAAIPTFPALAKGASSDRVETRYKKELLGREIAGENYLQGWKLKQLGSRVEVGRVSGPYHLSKNGWTAYAYQKVLEQSPDKKTLIRSQIVDVVLFKHGPGVDMTILCQYADGRTPEIQFAAVKFGRCERYSNSAQKAWRWDDKANAVVLSDLSGLRCEMIGFGQDPVTSKCIDWAKCYQHFNLPSNSVPDMKQRNYCSDNFLYPSATRSTR